jgi:hypothetical protein
MKMEFNVNEEVRVKKKKRKFFKFKGDIILEIETSHTGFG